MKALLKISNVWRKNLPWLIFLNRLCKRSAAVMRPSHLNVLGLVLMAGFGLAPLFVLSLVAAAILLVTRAIDAEEAFAFVQGRLLVLIFSMLAIGAGLGHAGAVALVVKALTPAIAGLSPFLLIWCFYLLTSLLTEVVSNNAVAVIITPLAIALAHDLGVDPRPLVVAVMVAASASFATPIGYQTNMLV